VQAAAARDSGTTGPGQAQRGGAYLGQNPPRSDRTDIMGFIQAASETLAKFPDGARKQLRMGTDLEENVATESART